MKPSQGSTSPATLSAPAPGDNGSSPRLAVVATGLTKSFGPRPVLRGVDLKVRAGECLVIFGPNGAGKTTLVKILATLMRPTSGKLQVAGWDAGEHPNEVRRRLGMVSHQSYLYGDLTARENLEFYGRMFGLGQLRERIDAVADQLGLGHFLDQRARALSRGMQQRLSLARAVLHQPAVLLLDEPETGLDQQALTLFGSLLSRVRTGNCTVIMTTHNLERGLAMADRAVILSKGRLVYEQSGRGSGLESLEDAYNRLTGPEHMDAGN